MTTTTRDLTDNERAVLNRVISASSSEYSSQLTTQAGVARVTGGLPTFLDLEVPTSAPSAPVEDGPFGQRAVVTSEEGDLCGEIMVWVNRPGKLGGSISRREDGVRGNQQAVSQ